MTIAFLLAGCSYSPRRGPEYTANTHRDDARIYHLRGAAILNGQTTLASLEPPLGPPDQVSDDGRFVGYLWEVTRWEGGRWTIGKPRPEEAQPRPRDSRRHFLLLGVDKSGVVQWHRRVHYDSSKGPLPTLHEAMEMTEGLDVKKPS
jgi:hypothetical protein